MTISKDDLVQRKEQITKDFEALSKEIETAEIKIKQMRNNLNALAGASQQCDLFLNDLKTVVSESTDSSIPKKKG